MSFTKKNFVSDMTDRELIYKTLVNGIPYGIIGSVTHHDEETNELVEIDGQIKGLRNNGYVEFYYPDGSFNLFRINDVKPYLRPLSSVTNDMWKVFDKHIDGVENFTRPTAIMCMDNAIHFLIKHHIDYRDMIDRGLALPAKDGMYSPPIWAFVPTGGR